MEEQNIWYEIGLWFMWILTIASFVGMCYYFGKFANECSYDHIRKQREKEEQEKQNKDYE